jgi:AbrB family looped-hinge helix DNA binding protein
MTYVGGPDDASSKSMRQGAAAACLLWSEFSCGVAAVEGWPIGLGLVSGGRGGGSLRGEFSKKVVNGFSFLAGGARKLLLCIGRYKGTGEQGLRPCYCKGESIQQSMAKVTSKFQVTVPKLIAQQFNIRPGDHIDWVAAGDVIRVIPSKARVESEDLESRIRLFDQATERLGRKPFGRKSKPPRERGWKREDLYGRGRSRRYKRSGLSV